jgi:hypothetical protein
LPKTTPKQASTPVATPAPTPQTTRVATSLGNFSRWTRSIAACSKTVCDEVRRGRMVESEMGLSVIRCEGAEIGNTEALRTQRIRIKCLNKAATLD